MWGFVPHLRVLVHGKFIVLVRHNCPCHVAVLGKGGCPCTAGIPLIMLSKHEKRPTLGHEFLGKPMTSEEGIRKKDGGLRDHPRP